MDNLTSGEFAWQKDSHLHITSASFEKRRSSGTGSSGDQELWERAHHSLKFWTAHVLFFLVFKGTTPFEASSNSFLLQQQISPMLSPSFSKTRKSFVFVGGRFSSLLPVAFFLLYEEHGLRQGSDTPSEQNGWQTSRLLAHMIYSVLKGLWLAINSKKVLWMWVCFSNFLISESTNYKSIKAMATSCTIGFIRTRFWSRREK